MLLSMPQKLQDRIDFYCNFAYFQVLHLYIMDVYYALKANS